VTELASSPPIVTPTRAFPYIEPNQPPVGTNRINAIALSPKFATVPKRTKWLSSKRTSVLHRRELLIQEGRDTTNRLALCGLLLWTWLTWSVAKEMWIPNLGCLVVQETTQLALLLQGQ